MGSNSIGFSTGSVVVPATSDTIDTCCRTSALTSDDFPALRRPKTPIWRRNDLGAGRMDIEYPLYELLRFARRPGRYLRP